MLFCVLVDKQVAGYAQFEKFGPCRLLVKKVWAGNIVIHFLAKLDNFQKVNFLFSQYFCRPAHTRIVQMLMPFFSESDVRDSPLAMKSLPQDCVNSFSVN